LRKTSDPFALDGGVTKDPVFK
jgi:hypothetical protein